MIIVSDGEENVKPYVSEVVDEVGTIFDWGRGATIRLGKGYSVADPRFPRQGHQPQRSGTPT